MNNISNENVIIEVNIRNIIYDDNSLNIFKEKSQVFLNYKLESMNKDLQDYCNDNCYDIKNFIFFKIKRKLSYDDFFNTYKGNITKIIKNHRYSELNKYVDSIISIIENYYNIEKIYFSEKYYNIFSNILKITI